MTDEPKCPKCRADMWTDNPWKRWNCGSSSPPVGFEQADRCRIRELTHQLATVTRQRDEAVAMLLEAAQWKDISGSETATQRKMIEWWYSEVAFIARQVHGLPTQQEIES